jgi:hypothetical protein
MKYIFFSIIILLSKTNQSQSLVINGDFEELTLCPRDRGDEESLLGWYSPSLGSPDIFNICAQNQNVSVPNNFFGSIQPFSQKGYIGLCIYENYSNIHIGKEYIQTQLAKPLLKDSIYKFSASLSIAQKSGLAARQIQIIFTTDSFVDYKRQELHYSHALDILKDSQPTIENWSRYEVIYKAKGGERYLTLGNFDKFDEMELQKLPKTKGFKRASKLAYYYFDDVVLIPYLSNVK